MLDERERHRIADRLRSGPAQALANLTMELRGLLRILGDDVPEVRPALESALLEAEQGLRELREIIEDLHPPLLFRELGFLPWLRDFAQRASAERGLTVAVDAPDTMPALRPEVAGVLLRVVQESVRNVVKHARATELVVRVRPEPSTLVLEVEDNGLGLDPEQVTRLYTDLQPKSTFGLAMMKEWAARVDAEFGVYPREGGGTIVRLQVPEPWQ